MLVYWFFLQFTAYKPQHISITSSSAVTCKPNLNRVVASTPIARSFTSLWHYIKYTGSDGWGTAALGNGAIAFYLVPHHMLNALKAI